jgi:two-component system CitB family sensor kinase
VPDELRETIFRDGVSTREGDGGRPRGLGLALARTAARARGGDVRLAETCEHGAVFVARLPEVLN